MGCRRCTLVILAFPMAFIETYRRPATSCCPGTGGEGFSDTSGPCHTSRDTRGIVQHLCAQFLRRRRVRDCHCANFIGLI